MDIRFSLEECHSGLHCGATMYLLGRSKKAIKG